MFQIKHFQLKMQIDAGEWLADCSTLVRVWRNSNLTESKSRVPSKVLSHEGRVPSKVTSQKKVNSNKSTALERSSLWGHYYILWGDTSVQQQRHPLATLTSDNSKIILMTTMATRDCNRDIPTAGDRDQFKVSNIMTTTVTLQRQVNTTINCLV